MSRSVRAHRGAVARPSIVFGWRVMPLISGYCRVIHLAADGRPWDTILKTHKDADAFTASPSFGGVRAATIHVTSVKAISPRSIPDDHYIVGGFDWMEKGGVRHVDLGTGGLVNCTRDGFDEWRLSDTNWYWEVRFDLGPLALWVRREGADEAARQAIAPFNHPTLGLITPKQLSFLGKLPAGSTVSQLESVQSIRRSNVKTH